MSRTIEDVLAIAGNRPVFETLVSILEAGRAIAFVGAGASAGMYPLWGKFIELLADHAVAEGKTEEKDAKRWKANTTSNPQQRVNVILGEYSQAYKPGIYRDIFKDLWVRERLAFLGFGFNDPQFTFMVGEFLRDLGGANPVPRHVAILSLPVDEGSVRGPRLTRRPVRTHRFKNDVALARAGQLHRVGGHEVVHGRARGHRQPHPGAHRVRLPGCSAPGRAVSSSSTTAGRGQSASPRSTTTSIRRAPSSSRASPSGS